MIFAIRDKKLYALAVLGGIMGAGWPADIVGDEAAEGAPDILMIMPDQMRGDAMSIVGHPAVRTPHLDGLAREGALFRRAYAEVPSCIPARYAMLTGMAPQASGVVGYTGTRVTRETMPQIFREAGYKTALVGRTMHQQNPDEELGYEHVIKGSVYSNRNDDYADFLKERLSPETELGGILHQQGLRDMVTAIGVTYNYWQAEPWPLDDDWHPIRWIGRESKKVVEETDDEQPLFLTSSFYAPHPPLFPSENYFNAYMEMELPDIARGDWVDWESLSPEGRLSNTRVLLEGETLRRAQAGYFGLIEQLDNEIAPLIEAFKERSEKAGRPWVIVVTSEHGEMLGDHGYFRKCEPYEGSANIPYVITASQGLEVERRVRSNEAVGLQDLLPTLADLAGIEPPEQVTGVSLVPTLRGEEQDVRPWYHFEHHPTYSDSQAFHALTDGRYKYIWRPLRKEGEKNEQLFDLENDPHEERDLAADPKHAEKLEQWRNRLIERLADRPEGFSDGKRLITGRPYSGHMPGSTP